MSVTLPLSSKQLTLLQRLSTAHAVQEMDRRAIQELGIPGILLMENAARSVTDAVEQEYLEFAPQLKTVICCGKGNNGGDGFAIARQLKNRGYNVCVVNAGEAKTEDALLNQKLWSQFGESFSYPGEEAITRLLNADIIIDAIFGTGLERPIEGMYQDWIKIICENTTAIKIAVDIPSGVNSDDSRIMGIAIQCCRTVSFQVGKQGCYQFPGADYTGKISVPDISIPLYWEESTPSTYLMTPQFIQNLLKPRPAAAHKGSFGHLLTVCGSAGMGGAAMLASYAALKTGAGLVSVCVPRILRESLPAQAPELMTLSPIGDEAEYFSEKHIQFVEKESSTRNAVVLGCGIGQHADTEPFVQSLVRHVNTPLLIDADGLNNLNGDHLKQRHFPTVITPHPKELSRLCGYSMAEIQSRRIETVRKLASEWKVIIVLKGAYSVIGSPDGTIFINPTGNEGMATAGTGDVLSGIIGSLLAQKYPPLQAALIGVYLHGLAGDCLRENLTTPWITAMDIIHGLNKAFSVLS